MECLAVVFWYLDRHALSSTLCSNSWINEMVAVDFNPSALPFSSVLFSFALPFQLKRRTHLALYSFDWPVKRMLKSHL